MKKEQVLILYTNPLFAEGLASLLRRERALEVVGVVEWKEVPWRKLQSTRPDIVIIEGKDLLQDGGSALGELLKCGKRARVISVNLEDQDAVLYVGMRLAATEANLIRAAKTRFEEDPLAQRCTAL